MSIDAFLQAAAPRGGYKNADRLRFRCESIFRGLDLSHSSVLEIGAGRGDLCFWAAYQGASEVVGLEPESSGATSGFIRDFEEMALRLGLDNVELRKESIQSFENHPGRFDVVVSHNSLEHLDEAAVRHLAEDAHARQIYGTILQKVWQLLRPGGYFVACNQSQPNFWPLIGRRNPFSPSVDWPLHPSTRLWKELLLANGFADVDLDWPVRYRLRNLNPLVANPIFAFFTDSMFRMVARRE